jgi:hypothetical protein
MLSESIFARGEVEDELPLLGLGLRKGLEAGLGVLTKMAKQSVMKLDVAGIARSAHAPALLRSGVR